MYEILQDEVLFQEFFLPQPGVSQLLSDHVWSPEVGRVVWWFQYPFILWPTGVWECGRAVGKALALDTPLPTLFGWTTMGGVRVGDMLFDERGEPCRVTFVSVVQHQRKCYRVVFSDGQSIVADAEHLWLTETHAARKAALRSKRPTRLPRIVTTKEIADSLVYCARGDHNHSIPLTEPLICPVVALPIDPYVFGLWLGDGSSATAELTVGQVDKEILGSVCMAGYNTKLIPQDMQKTPRYTFGTRPKKRDPKTGRMMANGSAHSLLRLIGVLGNKHIPDLYLRAAYRQRLDLLQGLMDSDGHVSRRGHCEYTSINRRLAEGVLELCHSLGIKAVLYCERARLYGKDCGPRYRVSFTTYISICRLARKRERIKAPGVQHQRIHRRYIIAVESVSSVPVRCIQVDSPSQLYLAGRGMIPTHNTKIGMEGGTAWDMVNMDGLSSAIAGPSEQHTMRVFDAVSDLLREHPFLSHWLSERSWGQMQRTERKLRTRNGWELRGLIPSRAGRGFKGEHPARLRVDETQDVMTAGMVQLDDAVRPFDPRRLGSRQHYFGVPNGDRTTRFYEMCHTKAATWSRWRRRMPSYLAPTMRRSDFIQVLDRTGCTYHEAPHGRIVVTNWSNDAKQNTLGVWGDPALPVIPVHVYEACTLPEGTPNYITVEITAGLLESSNTPPEDLVRRLLLEGSMRDQVPNLQKIYIAIDPGRENCPVLIWGKLSKPWRNHTAIYVLLGRVDIRRVMDTATQTRIIDAIADYWNADWVGADATSQGVYVTDTLCEKERFGWKGRYKLVDTSRGRAANCRSIEDLATARGWPYQVVLPVDFSGTIPDGWRLGEPSLKDTDVFTARLLQDLMQVSEPRLLLPNGNQDPELFGEATSYREIISGSGPRFYPPHPHLVSALKVTAAIIHYADLLDVQATPSDVEAGGSEFYSSSDLPF